MIGILTGYFIFGAFVDNKHPESTSWLKSLLPARRLFNRRIFVIA
jgi:hypothetical protein